MRSFPGKIFLLFLCILLQHYAYAQLKFYADVSSAAINTDDYINYRIIFKNAGTIQRVTPPSFNDFYVISGPEQAKDDSRSLMAFMYILKPRRPGNCTIGAASATVDGKNVKSNAIVVKVENAVTINSNQQPFPDYDLFDKQPVSTNKNDYILKEGDDVKEKVGNNMILKLEVNKTSCYVGQPIIAAYKLYSRLRSDTRLPQNLSFNGFSVVDLQQPGFDDVRKEKIGDKEYNVFTIRKAQLYALQAGMITLDPAEIDNEVRFVKEAFAKKIPASSDVSSWFSGSLFPAEAIVVKTISLKSLPVAIEVKPLPDNKPYSFNGAVGSFEINAFLQRPLFSTDEAGKLTVTISGSGNMQLLTAPDVEWPAGIESFEPKFTDILSKTSVPISGEKKFEYTFAATDSGHYILPAIHYSYFDPLKLKYVELSTDPIQFQVSKGKKQANPLDTLSKQYRQPSFINRIFYHRGWIIFVIALLMLSGIVVWIIIERKKPKPEATIVSAPSEKDEWIEQAANAVQMPQNPFTQTEQCLNEADCSVFYSMLNGELKQFLSTKFTLPVHAVNADAIGAVMDKNGISNNLVLQLQQLMHEIEWQLYTPFERNEKMEALYRRAQDIVQQINAQQVRRQ
ncbi:MAG: protein BatD [Bacteroidetes bacterium]|nr:protein BatD [Bacteroidota bacterium]